MKYFETQQQGAVSGQLNAPLLYPWDKCPRYPSNGRLVARQVRCECFVEETNPITMPRIEPQFLCRSARSLRHYNDYVTWAPQLNGNISSSFVAETWQLHSEDMTQREETEKLSQAVMPLTYIRKVLEFFLNFSCNTGYPNILVVFLSSPGKCRDNSTTRPWLSPSATFPIHYSLSIRWNIILDTSSILNEPKLNETAQRTHGWIYITYTWVN